MQKNLILFSILGWRLLNPIPVLATESEGLDFYSGDPVLEACVRSALEQSPALQSAWAGYRAALQKAPRVAALPDPMFTFNQFIRRVETRVGPQINTFNLSQKIPWFGKLDLAGQAAIKEAAAGYWQYLALERDLISQVKQSYHELQYLERAVHFTDEERSLLEHYERLARSRYESGLGLQQGVIKIQTELTRLEDRLRTLEQQHQSLTARLNTLMNRAPESPVAVARQSTLPEVELDLQGLYQLGEENRQELRASLNRIEANERMIRLRKKDYWPDLTLSAGMIHVGGRGDPAGVAMPPPDNGKNAYNVAIGITIPIWRDKYRAGVVEASERLVAERQGYLSMRNQIEYSIRDQVVRLETLQEQIRLYDQVLIPQAEASLRATESAYETGQLRVLDLLDGERLLVSSRLLRTRYHTDYLKALAELERAVGTKFPR